MIIAVGGWLAYGGADALPGFATLAKTPTTDSLSAAFSICDGSHQANCVVDGDTFWFEGEKILSPTSIRLNSARPAARLNG
uniref:Uncharacterized protein n=1 Tax=Agrobacterium tumefaciens TaxID=358 RepID=K7X7R7_AGRTU|nr:Hypothetical protein [Agrobacterium radiobacter]